MIITFGEPRQLTIMDADPEKSGIVSLPDNQIHSIPTWVDDGTIVAIIGATAGDQIALIDVRAGPRPGEAGALEAGERPRPPADLPDLFVRRPPLHLLGRRCDGRVARLDPARRGRPPEADGPATPPQDDR